MVEGRWLQVNENALYLGVKRDAVYKWTDRKQLAHKEGRQWKFRHLEVDEWVAFGQGDNGPASKGTG